MRNRRKNAKSCKKQVGIYPPKQEEKPIDKKAFMGKKTDCPTNLWLVRKDLIMEHATNGKPKRSKKIIYFLGGILFTFIGNIILDAFKLTETYDKAIRLILYIYQFIGL